MQHELKDAFSKFLVAGIPSILPVLYKKCTIPSFLRDTFYADFRDGKRYSTSFRLIAERFLDMSLAGIDLDDLRKELPDQGFELVPLEVQFAKTMPAAADLIADTFKTLAKEN